MTAGGVLQQNAYVSASGVQRTGSAYVNIVVFTPGTTASTLVLYDATTATGNPILSLAGAANGPSIFIDMNGFVCRTGVYATITGTAAVANILME